MGIIGIQGESNPYHYMVVSRWVFLTFSKTLSFFTTSSSICDSPVDLPPLYSTPDFWSTGCLAAMAFTGCALSKWKSKKSIDNAFLVNKETYCWRIQERAPELPHGSWEINFFFKVLLYRRKEVYLIRTTSLSGKIELQKLKEKKKQAKPTHLCAAAWLFSP